MPTMAATMIMAESATSPAPIGLIHRLGRVVSRSRHRAA
jgi:hypothetical protein